jgi:tetratricopeptide (TPR) repeat protein
MAEIRALATPQQARKSYPALVAKTYWLQAKRLAEAPFLTSISSTRRQNRINVREAYEKRGDAREAQGKHLKAAKLYATAQKFCLSSENEKKLALLAKGRNFSIESEQEQKLALLEKAEKATDAAMEGWDGKDTPFKPLFVEIAEQYCEEGEQRLDVGNTLFNMGQNEKAKASFEAAISDFDKAGEICEAYLEECRFVAENILEFRKKADTSLRQLG